MVMKNISRQGAKALKKTKKALRFYAWAGRRYREEKFERKFPL